MTNILPPHPFQAAALEAFANLLESCKSAASATGASEPVHATHVSPDSQSRFIKLRFEEMEATVQANLGLMHLSLAMTDDASIIPGNGKL